MFLFPFTELVAENYIDKLLIYRYLSEANVHGPLFYSPECSASALVPSLCEIVQPTQRGILSDTDKHCYAHTARAADI